MRSFWLLGSYSWYFQYNPSNKRVHASWISNWTEWPVTSRPAAFSPRPVCTNGQWATYYSPTFGLLASDKWQTLLGQLHLNLMDFFTHSRAPRQSVNVSYNNTAPSYEPSQCLMIVRVEDIITQEKHASKPAVTCIFNSSSTNQPQPCKTCKFFINTDPLCNMSKSAWLQFRTIEYHDAR